MDIGQFFVLHSKEGELPRGFQSIGLRWKTCLRDMVLGYGSLPYLDLPQCVALYQEQDAYQFILQITCGLDSPMLGETEVFGQFKKLIESIDESSRLRPLRKLLLAVQADTKKVRTDHLLNLGAQTYGSLLRKKLDSSLPIHILGSGQFTEDLLPWLNKSSSSVYVFARSPEKVQSKEVFQAVNVLSYEDLKSKNFNGSLIVACPMSAKDLQASIQLHEFSQIFDLRGESKSDPLILSGSSVEGLQSFFNQINNNKDKIQKKVGKALDKISQLAETKAKGQKLVPFGWDDLCA